ncbi:uncharacterized protein TNCV_4591491 [Trichonephila clavipes]|nr:uncharacterized protein TNCV_4591491 [Trichonephila clavipes]
MGSSNINFESYDASVEDWSSYVERLESYFVVNGIEDKMKVPDILSLMGATTYKLLKNLATPNIPSELTYQDIVKLLSEHLNPKPLEMTERFRFYKRKQFEDTGAAISCMNVNEFKKLCPDVAIKPTKLLLRNFDNSMITSVGQAVVQIQYKDQIHTEIIYLVHAKVNAVFGREWLRNFQLDWSSIKAVQFTCRNCGCGDRGRVAIYRLFGEVSLSLNRTVTCMVLKANERRTSCPCHDEFRGPRSDYVRQLEIDSKSKRIFDIYHPVISRHVEVLIHVKSIEAQTSSHWCGVEVKTGVPAQVSSSSLDHGSKLRGPSPKVLV